MYTVFMDDIDFSKQETQVLYESVCFINVYYNYSCISCFGVQLKYKETKHFSWPVMKVKKVKSIVETATSVKLAMAAFHVEEFYLKCS